MKKPMLALGVAAAVKNSNGKWAVIPTAGTKQTGMQRGCYNGLTLREQGAPEEFIRQAPICTPAEIGK